ncbi:MAG: response regulator [Oscillatoria sp. SIO1A7]|nr:response regulator [Oscillatoria sp. SIO1A7]
MKRILIVDDDRTLRAILKRHLENQGYSVEEVNSAIEALKLFQSDPPDLVVSDVMMPEMDGFEFCRRLRRDPQGKLVPFIFLSSRGELDDRIAGHSIGADDYLLKPFEPLELVAKIEAQLERSRRIHSEMIRLMQMASRVPALNQKPSGQTLLDAAESNASQVSRPARPWSDSSEEDEKTEDEKTEDDAPEPLPLTPAEARVFWEVIQGYTNKQIAANLFISPRTVQTHLRHILSKLNVENRSQLVRFAFENGYKPPAEQ